MIPETSFLKGQPELIRRLHERLLLALPGHEAQFRMAHINRISAMPMRKDVRKAAVLILLFEREDQWHVVLIRRRSIEGDVHAGQISFPGGRARADETPEEAALRESNEEIGSLSEDVRTLGRLTNLHIPVSNHLVFPVVGYLTNYSGWTLQDSEVDLILEIPVQEFLKEKNKATTTIILKESLILHDVPCYNINGYLIWGATAMILSEFEAMIN